MRRLRDWWSGIAFLLFRKGSLNRCLYRLLLFILLWLFMINRFRFPLPLREIILIRHRVLGLLWDDLQERHIVPTFLGNSVYLQEYRGIPGQLPDPDWLACDGSVKLAELRGVHLYDLKTPGLKKLDCLLGWTLDHDGTDIQDDHVDSFLLWDF
jgi:hypothetical protein